MKIENSPQSNLAYQKQLFNALDKIVSFRTELIKNTVLILNEGKDKEWPSVYNQIKFLRKQAAKTEDENIKTISKILTDLEKPILELEKNLELKNNFIQVITEQSMIEDTETVAV